MLPRLLSLTGKAYDFLFPRRCVGCGREGGFICPACRVLFSPIKPPICSLCGVPIPSGSLCSRRAGWKASIDSIGSAFRFEGPAREAVHQLKYQNLRAIAPDMAALMIQVVSPDSAPGDVIIPVPLHPKRLRERVTTRVAFFPGN
jgi:competence protein ComFC